MIRVREEAISEQLPLLPLPRIDRLTAIRLARQLGSSRSANIIVPAARREYHHGQFFVPNQVPIAIHFWTAAGVSQGDEDITVQDRKHRKANLLKMPGDLCDLCGESGWQSCRESARRAEKPNTTSQPQPGCLFASQT